MIPTKNRLAAMRQRQADQGLKRIEVIAYSEDEQEIRRLADSLRMSRKSEIEAQAATGYPSSTMNTIASN